jgi:predicted acylesterase/phospholipase RssA/CRP-like cAMP-binding protein
VTAGDTLGELSLLYPEQRRPQTVTALSDARLYELSRRSFKAPFDELMHRHPDEFKRMAAIITEKQQAAVTTHPRPAPAALIAALKRSRFFSELGDRALAELEAKARWVYLPSRQVLIEEGAPSKSLYLVVSGKLRGVLKNAAGHAVASSDFLPGETIGEISMILGTNVIAAVSAVRNCELLEFEKTIVDEIWRQHHGILLAMTRTAVARAQENLTRVPRPPRYETIALVPLSGGVPVREFGARLSKALEHFGTVLHVTRERMDEALGAGSSDAALGQPGYGKARSWLSEMERRYDCLLLEADAVPTSWSEQCVRDADRILLVANAADSSNLAPVEMQLLGRETHELAPKQELVLLHEDTRPPVATEHWLGKRSVVRHHHFARLAEPAFARLARILNGTSLGLVFGGGGAKAAAHIGLIRAFQEAGIPIDHVGGTSIGSLIAALWASGHTTESIKEIIETRVATTNLVNDYILPSVSFVRGKKYSKFIHAVCGDAMIEDLWLDYFSVACDLTIGEMKVFRRGSLWKSVRASSSLPAILPPLLEDGHLYVDGALLDNVPGDTMRSLGVGRVVTVDISSYSQEDADRPLGALLERAGQAPSWWRLFKNKFARQRVLYPGLGDILMRATLIGSRERASRLKTTMDLYVKLPVDEFGILDYKATSKLVEIGYDYSRANVDEWKRKLKLA